MSTDNDSSAERLLYPAKRTATDTLAEPLKADAVLPPNSLITIGELAHFSVADHDTSASMAQILAADAAKIFSLSDTRVFGLARDGAVDQLEKTLTDRYLLPRAGTPAANGKLDSLPMDEALKKIRTSLLTHSFGERIARDAGQRLLKELQDPAIFNTPYNEDQARALCKQILVIGLGAALDYDHEKMADSGRVEYMTPESPLNHVSLYAEKESSVRSVAEAYPDSFLISCRGHDQNHYMDALQKQPDVATALSYLIKNSELPPNASESLDPFLSRSNLLNENPGLDPSLISLAKIPNISIRDNKVFYSHNGGTPEEILTITPTNRGLRLDPAEGQRENLGHAMNHSQALQHNVLDNLNAIYSDRATIMARHQIEARIRKGQPIERRPDQRYDFEDRIRAEVSEKEARKKDTQAVDGLIWEFSGDVPSGKPPELIPIDLHDPSTTDMEENANRLNRQAKEHRRQLKLAEPTTINPGDVITIGGADHFAGLDKNQQRVNSMKYAAELQHLLELPEHKVKTLIVTKNMRDSHDLEGVDDMAEYIARELLVPRVTKGEAGKLEPKSIEEAQADMRFTLATHSFGGKLASLTMIAFEKQITDPEIVHPPFSKDEARQISSQLFQLDLGPSFDYSYDDNGTPELVAFNSPSTRAQLYLRKDPDLHFAHEKINKGDEDIKSSHIYLLETPPANHRFMKWSSSMDFSGKDLHTRSLYIESIEQQPPLVKAIRDAVNSPYIDKEKLLAEFAGLMEKVDVTKPQELPELQDTSAVALQEPAKQVSRTA